MKWNRVRVRHARHPVDVYMFRVPPLNGTPRSIGNKADVLNSHAFRKSERHGRSLNRVDREIFVILQ